MIAGADLIIDNMRPGALARMGSADGRAARRSTRGSSPWR